MKSDSSPPTASSSSVDSSRQPGDSILDSIERRTGRSAKVSLHESGGEDSTPIVDPRARGIQDQLSGRDRGKYQVLGEIARGGMGVVLRGHDNELGRDVAMKVVHSELADREEVIARFVEEAQIGGQLQHPGIVPVYELGLMEDQRPYFTMKLVKGRTLAKMLVRRKSPEEDRVRFLSIFESICQTMAYAHSKGVVHRDLKPANVMVGSFGEVQIVDWGLSKVLGGGGVADELAARKEAQTIISTVRSGPGSGSGSMVGNVLGTPEYMAPEQAQGEVDRLDERTDVFMLGAILCELLTGAPPYVAKNNGELLQMAAGAKLDDARARLDAASASEELKELCRSCLTPAQQARPSSAEEVANSIHDHIAGLESAAHEAQLASAEDRLRAERSRRRLQLMLAAVAILILAVGGWRWVEEQRAERQAGLAASFASLKTEALQSERSGNFSEAVEIARGGLRLVQADETTSDLRDQAQSLVEATELSLAAEELRLSKIERERQLFDFLLDIEMRQVSTGFVQTDEELDAQYATAFRDWGLDLESAESVERLLAERDTDLGIRLALGFDGWSRLLRRIADDGNSNLRLLTGLGMDLDSNPLRTELRLALVDRDADRLLLIAQRLDLSTSKPETLSLAGMSLREFRHYEQSRSLFVKAANLYPSSFLLNYGAGTALMELDPAKSNQSFQGAIGYLKVALALKPDLIGLHVDLGDLYRARGNDILSAQYQDQILKAAPDARWNKFTIANTYRQAGRHEDAIRWYQNDIDTGVGNPVSESGIIASQIVLGIKTIEDYIDWAEQAREAGKWFPELGPAAALCNPGWGVEPDPERARDLLETYLPEGLPERWYWGSLATAYFLTGDIPAARAAQAKQIALRPEEDAVINLMEEAIYKLLNAIAARVEGDEVTVNSNLVRARRLRDELIAGMEEEWAASIFLKTFDYYESLAMGN